MMEDVMPGQEFIVRVFPGKDGKPISRLPDGRPVLFGQQFVMTAKLHNGDIVKIRVIKPSATYLLVQPIALLDADSLPPEAEFEATPQFHPTPKYTKTPIAAASVQVPTPTPAHCNLGQSHPCGKTTGLCSAG